MTIHDYFEEVVISGDHSPADEPEQEPGLAEAELFGDQDQATALDGQNNPDRQVTEPFTKRVNNGQAQDEQVIEMGTNLDHQLDPETKFEGTGIGQEGQDNEDTESSTPELTKSQSITLVGWGWDVIIWIEYFKTHYRYQISTVFLFIRFVIWVNKVSEDFGQASEYAEQDDMAFFAVSAIMVALPTLLCTLYNVINLLIASECSPKLDKLFVTVLNGLLLVPWQVRNSLNALHYNCQRIRKFVWSVYEQKKVFDLGVDCDLLEFFEDVFSGFLGICFQVYLLMVNYGWTGEPVEEDANLISTEMVLSALSLLSILGAFRRRDDTFFTASLVGFGWIFLFMSRALAIALAITVLKFWILPLILGHCIGLNFWVYHIVKLSYYDLIMADEQYVIDWKIGFGRGRALLWCQSFILYGLPSLIYWPLMFQMKDRASKFLLIMCLENVAFIIIWSIGVHLKQISVVSYSHLLWVSSTVVVLTLLAIFFILIYLKLKPSHQDKKVLLNISLKNSAAKDQCAMDYGVSFIFYQKIFPLPTSKQILKSIPPFCDEDKLLFNITFPESDMESITISNEDVESGLLDETRFQIGKRQGHQIEKIPSDLARSEERGECFSYNAGIFDFFEDRDESELGSNSSSSSTFQANKLHKERSETMEEDEKVEKDKVQWEDPPLDQNDVNKDKKGEVPETRDPVERDYANLPHSQNQWQDLVPNQDQGVYGSLDWSLISSISSASDELGSNVRGFQQSQA